MANLIAKYAPKLKTARKATITVIARKPLALLFMRCSLNQGEGDANSLFLQVLSNASATSPTLRSGLESALGSLTFVTASIQETGATQFQNRLQLPNQIASCELSLQL